MNEEQRIRMREDIMLELNQHQQISDEELYTMIDEKIIRLGMTEYLPLREKLILRGWLFDSFRRLGILQELVDDKTVTEIMVNGANNIFIERNGRMERWEKEFESQEQLEDMIQQIVSRVNRTVNVSRPIADARLGGRVQGSCCPAPGFH